MTDAERSVLSQLTLGPKTADDLYNGSCGALGMFGENSIYIVLMRLMNLSMITRWRVPDPRFYYTITDLGTAALEHNPSPLPNAVTWRPRGRRFFGKVTWHQYRHDEATGLTFQVPSRRYWWIVFLNRNSNRWFIGRYARRVLENMRVDYTLDIP